MARTNFSDLRKEIADRPGALERLAPKRAETLGESRRYQLLEPAEDGRSGSTRVTTETSDRRLLGEASRPKARYRRQPLVEGRARGTAAGTSWNGLGGGSATVVGASDAAMSSQGRLSDAGAILAGDARSGR